MESNLSANSTRITNLESNLSANSTRITNLESNLSANSIRITNLESEIQPVNRGGTNITSYGTGDMLYASSSSALSKLTPSTAGFFLQTNGTGNAPTWENVADIGSATPANLYTDDYITGGPWSGLSDANIRVLGNVSNLSNQLVARDDKGDIFVSNVNAIKIYGDGTTLTGVALSTDLSSNVTRIGDLETKTTDISYTNSGTSKTTIASDLKVTGKLGIGESSPTTPLHIECADISSQNQNGLLVKQSSSSHPAIIGIRTSSTSQDPFISFMVNSDSSGWSYGVDASESSKLKWAYNTSDLTTNTKMTLTQDGKLGIGESSPEASLDVRAYGSSNPWENGLLVKQDSSSHPAIIGIRTSSTSQDPFISFMVNSDSTGWSYGVDASDTYKLKWADNTSDLTTNTRMTLTQDGKLGIGTSSPFYKLDVNGTMHVTGALYVGSPSPSAGTNGQVLTSSGGGAMSWTTVSSSGSNPWTTSGSVIHYNTGNVGINTSTPQYKLDVDGDIRTTSEGGFRGNGRNVTGINITSERNQTIINLGQQSSLKKSVNGDPL